MEHLKIPAERFKIIIKDGAKVVKDVEKATNTKIILDNNLCEVVIEAGADMKDPLLIWTARDVIRAIGRGFKPKVAMGIIEAGYELRVLNLKEYIGKSKNALTRIKGRVIGSRGKSKKAIGTLTDTDIVIYGKTVSIIGTYENVYIAARAIVMLANGSMHGTVYGFIKHEMENLVK